MFYVRTHTFSPLFSLVLANVIVLSFLTGVVKALRVIPEEPLGAATNTNLSPVAVQGPVPWSQRRAGREKHPAQFPPQLLTVLDLCASKATSNSRNSGPFPPPSVSLTSQALQALAVCWCSAQSISTPASG